MITYTDKVRSLSHLVPLLIHQPLYSNSLSGSPTPF